MSNSERSTSGPSRPNRLLPRQPSRSSTERLDVICAGMYRACSTWQYTVAAHLVEQFRGGRRLGYLSGEEYAARSLKQTSSPHAPMGLPKSAVGAAWTVFKSHDGDRFFARAVANRQARVLYAYRDVRDVVFSLMHKRGLTFEQLLRQGMIQQILRNDRFWTKGDSVLIQKYEDLIDDPTTGVMQIADHLGISIDLDRAAAIASEYSAESNRARIETLQNELRKSGLDLTDSSNQQLCDPTTLLHWNHLRPARTRTWRELATPPQRRMLERYFGSWLEARGYPRDDLRFDTAGAPRSTFLARVGDELNALRGWVSCRLHAATLDHPRASRIARRIIGRGDSEAVGAVAWRNPATNEGAPTASRGSDVHSPRQSA